MWRGAEVASIDNRDEIDSERQRLCVRAEVATLFGS